MKKLNCLNCDYFKKLPDGSNYCTMLEIRNLNQQQIMKGCRYHSENEGFWKQLEKDLFGTVEAEVVPA